MYNVVFESNTDRQAVFNDKNPIICMLIHHFKKKILVTHIFFKDEDSEIDFLKNSYGDDPDMYFHHIPNMNRTNFAKAAYEELMKYSDTVEIMNADYEEFDPVIISGSFYATDQIVAAMNEIFKQRKKDLEAKGKYFEIFTLCSRGIMSLEQCKNIINMNFSKLKFESFENDITGMAYMKAIISTPSLK